MANKLVAESLITGSTVNAGEWLMNSRGKKARLVRCDKPNTAADDGWITVRSNDGRRVTSSAAGWGLRVLIEL